MTETQPRTGKRAQRQKAIADAVMAAGALRIEELAERFSISLMTVHRDLDDLEERGILRKSRGVATALASTLVESSIMYREGLARAEKESIARTALDYVEPGQSIFIDDSTTVHHLIPLLVEKAPLTVITNSLTAMNMLTGLRGITVIGLGGSYHNWCTSFMGRMTTDAITKLRSDIAFISAPSLIGSTIYYQALETVDTKRAMIDSAAVRVLMLDHTKFGRRALHELASVREFDVVIVDAATDPDEVERLRSEDVGVVVAAAESTDE
ncbi:DeoR/GlpR family DNA-binding transcription regulator [Paramicrobacterium agarici]|uniref:DeoR family transcriptional regulator n=1 Tax=Paramicrobacterium agarici TaxID=630514 RepID=A0A2A9E1A0_9MICO|nr:DeoR/GlpR family DNA-binding transcription regulator [Microbacterium agarici]PFG31969.1 DeoR family transcriptional regulator [Microbacterium agarici]TQO21860.1 DeoR family transcriptional regulator [Microbacterium agarici]